jgi:hypothetical protein
MVDFPRLMDRNAVKCDKVCGAAPKAVFATIPAKPSPHCMGVTLIITCTDFLEPSLARPSYSLFQSTFRLPEIIGQDVRKHEKNSIVVYQVNQL